MRWTAVPVVLSIVLGVGLALASPSEAAKSFAPPKAKTGPSQVLSRSGEVDGIVLRAVLSSVKADGPIALDFSMDTHSGSLLGFVPQKDVGLRVNGEETPASFKYTPGVESAHHRTGRLVITAPDGSGFHAKGGIRSISLKFANLGEAAGSVVLEWQFGEGGK